MFRFSSRNMKRFFVKNSRFEKYIFYVGETLELCLLAKAQCASLQFMAVKVIRSHQSKAQFCIPLY